jgi:hypothetical protein
MFPLTHWFVALITALAVVACVLVHYEGLRLLSDNLPKTEFRHRRRVLIMIFCLLFLHIIEIWIFGGAYYLLLRMDGYGELVGAPAATLIDCIYFSASVFTTVGFGDIVPVGAIRTMVGTEGVAGLTLITWSASYTFLEMLKRWNNGD